MQKYPNPMGPSVVGAAVLGRPRGPSGKLHGHRLLSTAWGLPSAVKSLVGVAGTKTHVQDHSEVDPGEKTMELKPTNISLANMVPVDERLIHKAHPQDPEKTHFNSRGHNHCERSQAQKSSQRAAGKSISNADRGLEAMAWLMHRLNAEIENRRLQQKGAYRCQWQ